jgi:hypothetical protein
MRDQYEYYRKRIVPNRCNACHPCPMGVVGCTCDTVPHSHGGAIICEECGYPYYETHPHSRCCSKATPVVNSVVHSEPMKKIQLGWDCSRYKPRR